MVAIVLEKCVKTFIVTTIKKEIINKKNDIYFERSLVEKLVYLIVLNVHSCNLKSVF